MMWQDWDGTPENIPNSGLRPPRPDDAPDDAMLFTQRMGAFIKRGLVEKRMVDALHWAYCRVGSPRHWNGRPVDEPEPPRDAYAMALGAAVRHARKMRGLTLRDAADLLGVDVVQVSAWERGKECVPDDQLRQLAEAG